MFKITLLIPYFGRFPDWAPLFFETLRRNHTIKFVFFTDCKTTGFEAPNIRFNHTTFGEYIEFARKKADIEFDPSSPYKLCDLRPLYGMLHDEDIADADFYGWTDMDLLFGDIRKFYTDDILHRYDVLSTHQVRISGHLALFRNTPKNKTMYKKIYQWRKFLAQPEFVGIDEHGITNAYRMTWFDRFNEKFGTRYSNFATRWASRQKQNRLYMVEQYTTPFTAIPWLDGSLHSRQPDEWYYKDGVITNNRDGGREFMYIHFMNFKNSQWRHDGTPAPWEGKKQVCFAGVSDMERGIVINTEGIRSIF